MRTTLLTGVSKGIGRAIAMRLASEGARIAVVSRTEKNSIQVADEINARFAGLAKAYAVDAADHAAGDRAHRTLAALELDLAHRFHHAHAHGLRSLRLFSRTHDV